MKHKYKLLMVLVIACSGCEDQLNVAPISNLTTDTYFVNEADAKSALTGAYSQLNFIYRDENIVTPNIVGADDGIPFLTGNADRRALWSYNILPTNTFVGNIWSAAYTGIQRANIVITRTPGIPMDESLRNRFIAEAKYLRAIHYFNLVRFFGGVPLVADETTSVENLNIGRASRDEVYDFIESDLTDAEDVLPESYGAADVGRATRGAAKGLLAKVYLTRAGASASPYWAMAAEKAKEVIDAGTYGLWENFADAFALANKGGKESVFEIVYLTDVSGTNFSTGYAPRGAPIVPNNGSGILRVSKQLYDLYLDEDKRKSVTFLTSYTTPGSGVVVNLSPTDADPARATSFWKLSDPSSRVGGQAGKSFPYMRFSEVLLIYAEAVNEANGGPSADAYLAFNSVRERAGLNPLVDLTQAQFREAVLQERRLELAFEGHRWFDLARTARLVDAVAAETSFGRAPAIQPYNALFPIPQREIDANTALRDQQNEGYF